MPRTSGSRLDGYLMFGRRRDRPTTLLSANKVGPDRNRNMSDEQKKPSGAIATILTIVGAAIVYALFKILTGSM